MGLGIVITGCGLFGAAAVFFNWEFFMNHYKARFMIRILGRTGARLFYGVLGVALTILGILIMTGVIQEGE